MSWRRKLPARAKTENERAGNRQRRQNVRMRRHVESLTDEDKIIMRFVYGKSDWRDAERGLENCFLLTNGLGGFCSQSITGANARNDQGVLMACVQAPTERVLLVSRIEEELWTDGCEDCGKVSLSAQQYVDYTKNLDGQIWLQSFVKEDFPVWTYQVGGVEIVKTMAMKYGENTVGIRYELTNRSRRECVLWLTPYFQFTKKGEKTPEGKRFALQCRDGKEGCVGAVASDGITLYFASDAHAEAMVPVWAEDFYYAHDSRDGRNCVGRAMANHKLSFAVPAGEKRCCEVIYSLEQDFTELGKQPDFVKALQRQERERLQELIQKSKIADECGRELLKGADQFVVKRESTGGKTIIAGYPFFADWGRDTMIALTGCCLSAGRFEDARNIFRTFMKYCRRGIMPNLFPETGQEPLYNTADASLLFILAVYEYYTRTNDISFILEAYPVMESIVGWYQQGTDFHIGMDTDGLIFAGAGLEQVTWMDVRYQDILPTPRHGKPVEINAYWYNALRIMEIFAGLCQKDGQEYAQLAKKVQESFRKKFWNASNNCLKDVLAADEDGLTDAEKKRRKRAENQIRCNQIWAVSQRFSILEEEQEKAVVDTVFEKLYTPWGLRSLAADDEEFHPRYTGNMKSRDLAYHQGTVWGFPLGGYYLAYLKVNHYSEEAKQTVKRQLFGIEGAMREGCIGQLAEVYDGQNPNLSEGCFAQAWSTAELLRVYEALA